MINERRKVFYTLLIIIDAFVITAAFLAAYFLRKNFHAFYTFDLFPHAEIVNEISLEEGLYANVYLLGLITWIPVLWVVGFYNSFRTSSYLKEVWLLFKASILTILTFGSLAFIFKVEFVSRMFLGIFIATSSLFLLITRLVVVKITRSLRRRGRNYRQILLVGTGPRAKKFIGLLYKHAEWGLKIKGLLDIDPEKVGKNFFGIKCIGTIDDISKILDRCVIDEVVVVVPRSWLTSIQNLVSICELRGIQVNVASDLFDLNIARATQRDLDGFPLMTFETTFVHEWDLIIKRMFDILFSLSGIFFFFPLFLLVAIIIKITSPGPVFFQQKRVGLNGRPFYLHKFRSMNKNASAQLEKVQHLNEMDGPVFKIKNDPRVFPFGKILRKTSIDELPQLLDVLVGNISIVGPRPPLPKEVEQYEPWQKRRLSMRPGITCLWQIMGRNKLSFKQWMELDLQYIDNWSLWLDFKILMRTIPTVIFGDGAS
ncbi:MAG: sugar transferase [Candidatus Aceula meridiana]|nr:sugar transferase [Candidatus Aceula meridiana]